MGDIFYYKAAVKSEVASKINTQQLTIIARRGVAPVRWGLSLQVLLKKIGGHISCRKTEVHPAL